MIREKGEVGIQKILIWRGIVKILVIRNWTLEEKVVLKTAFSIGSNWKVGMDYVSFALENIKVEEV